MLIWPSTAECKVCRQMLIETDLHKSLIRMTVQSAQMGDDFANRQTRGRIGEGVPCNRGISRRPTVARWRRSQAAQRAQAVAQLAGAVLSIFPAAG